MYKELNFSIEKANLLDDILKEFGARKNMSTRKVLRLCRGDERQAIDYISLLANFKLIKIAKSPQGKSLPQKIGKTPNAYDFLLLGGFSDLHSVSS